MIEKFFQNAKKEYSLRSRYIILFFAGILFLLLLPLALISLGSSLDRWLGLPRLLFKPFNPILGALLVAAGWFLGIWSNYVQVTIGHGTPVPLMATQKLIIQPPYSFSRNPMALGAIVMYLGVAVWIGSLGALFLVIIGAAALLTYIKLLEEKEMEIRFGQEYLSYKERTPFFFPRFSKKE